MSDNIEKDDNLKTTEGPSFLYERKPKHLYEESADDKFDVIVPAKNLIILIVIFAGLFFAQFFYFSGLYELVLYPENYDAANYEGGYIFVPFIFLAMAIVVIIAWGEIGSRFGAMSIVKYLRKTTSKTRPRPLEILLGYPLRTKDIYYLEAFPVDLDLGSNIASTKIFIKRVIEVLFLSMGMSVIIAQTVAPFLYARINAVHPDWYRNINELIIDMVLYLGPLTLIILLFIMPVFWIAEDTQAYRIDQTQDAVRLGFYLRNGAISKILGFFGIVLVFNLAQGFATGLVMGDKEMTNAQLMSQPDLAIQVYTQTFLWFGIIIAMSAAIPFLVTFVYMSRYHERWVNNVRVQASEFMPLGTLEIRRPISSNLKYVKHPEMVDDSGNFFQTKNGKILLLVLIIAVAIICIYLAFIWGFEDALFG